jgi:hypothetical protein
MLSVHFVDTDRSKSTTKSSKQSNKGLFIWKSGPPATTGILLPFGLKWSVKEVE